MSAPLHPLSGCLVWASEHITIVCSESVAFAFKILQVGDVKGVIATTKSLPLEGMKLIFSGAVLTDTQTLESIGVKETDFLVCVAKKTVRGRPAFVRLRLACLWRIRVLGVA